MNTGDHFFFQTIRPIIIVFAKVNSMFLSTAFNATISTVMVLVIFVKRF